jgi:oligosaccharide repeat unit polymerase
MRKVSLNNTAEGQGLPQGESPFISITMGYRILIIGYVLLYNIFIPGLQYILYGSTAPLVEWRFVTSVIYELLLLMPILYYRPDYGWLHPLIFPTVYSLAKGLLSNPDQLLAPSLFTEPSSGEIDYIALKGWSQVSLAWAALKGQLISMTALATYYLGFFFGPQLPISHLRFLKPRNVAPKALSFVACSTAIFLVYMRLRGGLTGHMTSWGQGRFESLQGYGIIMVLIQCGMVASLVWFTLDRMASRNPLFWAAVLFSVPVNFFTGGSRSAVLTAGCMFVVIWIIRNRKIPYGKIAILGIGGLVLIAFLGHLRRSSFQGEVDLTAAAEFNLQESVEVSRGEIEARSAYEAHLPIIARVLDEIDLLYGKSYVGALLFFVPRALWPDKPRGAGAMNASINFGTRGGVPVGPVWEAYWNFYIPGVVIIYFLYGLFHQWLARAFAHFARAPAFWVLYVITLFTFSPGGFIVAWFHQMIPAMAVLYWMGALSFSKRKVYQHVIA